MSYHSKTGNLILTLELANLDHLLDKPILQQLLELFPEDPALVTHEKLYFLNHRTLERHAIDIKELLLRTICISK